jgi:hypothetical protein
MHLAAKRALEELDSRSKGIGGSAAQDKNTIMSRISHVSTRLDCEIADLCHLCMHRT